MSICNFGCGNEAVITFKNGKSCCSTATARCPAIKARINESNKDFHFVRKPKVKESHPGMIPEIWNKGLTKETDDRVRRSVQRRDGKKKECSQEHRDKISRSLRGRMPKFIPTNGYGKRGTYKGIRCDSSWELAFIVYYLENGIAFKKNVDRFSYTFKGQIRQYEPDFILDDGTFVEIKGNFDAKSRAKIEQFPHKILLIRKKEMQPILTYVKEKHGDDFVKLYDKIEN